MSYKKSQKIFKNVKVTCELGAGEDGVSHFGFKSCPPISCRIINVVKLRNN